MSERSPDYPDGGMTIIFVDEFDVDPGFRDLVESLQTAGDDNEVGLGRANFVQNGGSIVFDGFAYLALPLEAHGQVETSLLTPKSDITEDSIPENRSQALGFVIFSSTNSLHHCIKSDCDRGYFPCDITVQSIGADTRIPPNVEQNQVQPVPVIPPAQGDHDHTFLYIPNVCYSSACLYHSNPPGTCTRLLSQGETPQQEVDDSVIDIWVMWTNPEITSIDEQRAILQGLLDKISQTRVGGAAPFWYANEARLNCISEELLSSLGFAKSYETLRPVCEDLSLQETIWVKDDAPASNVARPSQSQIVKSVNSCPDTMELHAAMGDSMLQLLDEGFSPAFAESCFENMG